MSVKKRAMKAELKTAKALIYDMAMYLRNESIGELAKDRPNQFKLDRVFEFVSRGRDIGACN